jgi:hypothetical protein
MPLMLIFNAPNMTQTQYDALRPVVQWENNPPAGLNLHSCAFDDQGGLHVCDLWESGEHVQHFFETRLKPGFEQLGLDPGQPQIMPAHNINTTAAAGNYQIGASQSAG